MSCERSGIGKPAFQIAPKQLPTSYRTNRSGRFAGDFDRPRRAERVRTAHSGILDAAIEIMDLVDGDPEVEVNGDEEDGDGV
jgi:hypothetical protein